MCPASPAFAGGLSTTEPSEKPFWWTVYGCFSRTISIAYIVFWEKERVRECVCVCVCVYVCVCEKWYLLLLGDLCGLYPDSIWRLGISLPSLTKDFSIQDSFHAVTQVGQCLHGLSVCACFGYFQSFISLKLVNLILGKAAHEGGLLVLIKVIVKKEIH